MSSNCMYNAQGGVSLDGNTAQSFLDTSTFTTIPQQLITHDEGDVFQCGKCKLVLLSLSEFMLHKRQHNSLETVHAEVIYDEPIDLVTLGESQIWFWPPYTEPILTHTVSDQNILSNDNLFEDDPHVEEAIEQPESIYAPPLVAPLIPTIGKNSKFSCPICKKEFSKQFDLSQHHRSHTGEKPFQCAVCGRAFAQKSNVKKHMLTHKIWPDDVSKTLPAAPTCEANIYVCPYCKETYETYIKLKAHLKTHKDHKVYKCIQLKCNAMFYDAESLLNHVAESHPAPIYRCHMCFILLNSLEELASHQQTHPSIVKKSESSGKSTKKYKCLQCKTSFATPENLASHSATASHKHECQVCKKIFTSERFLRRHLSLHDSSTSFICNTCGKTFRTEHYLNCHMLLHNASRPFNCSQCSASFNRKDKLIRHAQIHQPNKKYKCPFSNYLGCTKEFHRQDKLKLHLITHTKTKNDKKKKKGKSKNIKPAEQNTDLPTVELIVVPLTDGACDGPITVTCPVSK